MRRNTSVVLGAHFDEFVADAIQKGYYQTVSEAVRAGLKLLERDQQEHEEKLKLLREKLEKGRSSPVIEDFSPEEFLEDMHRKHL